MFIYITFDKWTCANWVTLWDWQHLGGIEIHYMDIYMYSHVLRLLITEILGDSIGISSVQMIEPEMEEYWWVLLGWFLANLVVESVVVRLVC